MMANLLGARSAGRWGVIPCAFLAALATAQVAGKPGGAVARNGWHVALEAHAAHVMEGRSGAALLLAVDSGQLLAMHNEQVASRQLAAPGSTVKPFTLMALLASGKLNVNTRWMCPRRLEIAGRNLDCSHPISGQAFDARTALAWSCNNWFAHMSARLDARELREALAGAGFTAPTGLVPGEATGRVPEVTTLDDQQLQAIGAANIEITPLELAAAYRRLALLRRDAEGAEKFGAVFQGLEDSVAYGMAQTANLGEAPPLAGKTGTAGSGSGWTHAWFAGYWPAAKPEVVVVVFLERGRGGPDAAPVARELVAYYRTSKPVAP